MRSSEADESGEVPVEPGEAEPFLELSEEQKIAEAREAIRLANVMIDAGVEGLQDWSSGDVERDVATVTKFLMMAGSPDLVMVVAGVAVARLAGRDTSV